ncbi:MAG: PEP/pyruvate-binding domain-containing protein [Dehalococcoidia bacterium]
MSRIRWLGDDDCHHEGIVGGKAASLSRLASRHTVPPGFAIAAVPAAGHSIGDGLLPAIEHAYHRLAERCGASDPPVAVRSSALDEDGSDASFAGQHDTYLNIRGVDAVLDAVRRCVMSASSNEALAYRRQRGLTVDDVQMAVLVQQLVRSDVSAVVFSANPISGSRDEVMINSNWGLGESIVGGSATPDTFVVRKQGLEVSWRDIARKDRMTILTEAGTCEGDVPADLQTAPSLDDSQILEMTRLALALEDAIGHAVDVECAIARDTLYLLQCRPITTLG